MEGQSPKRVSKGLALLPFIVFVVVFLGSGIILNIQGVFKPFSQFPPLAAAYIAIIVAFLLHKGTGKEKLNLLLEGIARPNIALVVLIFALAGAFSSVAKGMGGVDSVVNLCLTIIPQKYIIMGVFVIGCIVSFASGSSLGTATMIAPIALGIVEATGVPLALTMGAVFSGGMFGNQISPISDCTIASTTGMNVSLKDKNKYNVVLAIPALLISAALFMTKTADAAATMTIGSYSLLKILPYIAVLGLSVTGVSVVTCLSVGILLAGIIGIAVGDYTIITFLQGAANGAIGMGSMILLVMLIGGIAYMVDKMGGINFIVDKLSGVGNSSKSGHLIIVVLTVLVMLCVANDTVTIMIVCPLAKEICKKFRVDPRCVSVTIPVFAAAISPLCPWSGFTFTLQGLVNQAGFDLSFVDTFPVTYYPLVLCAITVAAIFVPIAAKKVFKTEWDYENNCPKA